MSDTYAVDNGFASERERLAMIFAVPSYKMAQLEHWMDTDGTKDGLLHLLYECSRCWGIGQTGLHPTGAPIECSRCEGLGHKIPRNEMELQDEPPFLPTDDA